MAGTAAEAAAKALHSLLQEHVPPTERCTWDKLPDFQRQQTRAMVRTVLAAFHAHIEPAAPLP
jgi:hypothetical protein